MSTIANVVGARPQFVKAGPVSKALREAGLPEVLIHTGQHYDPILSDRIIADIGLSPPEHHLGVGSGGHAEQTALIMERVERLFEETRPDVAIVYGDTNSTMAAALAAAKLGIPIAHVEAGMRSFNRSMPEEVNRIVADHVADLLLAATDTAMANLAREGLASRSWLTGDVMVDALQSIDFSNVSLPDWADGSFYAATIHRAENTDDRERLGRIVASLEAMDRPVHLLAHPRLVKMLSTWNINPGGSVEVHPPLGYAEMLAVARSSAGLITDSGGLQKEAFILGVPCITLRNETEWPETLTGAWNVLAGPGDDLADLANRNVGERSVAPFGDGNAARRVVEHLESILVVDD